LLTENGDGYFTVMLAAEHRHFTSRVREWLRPYVRPRRFHAFGIGMPKTGTHSLAGVFINYRAEHELAMEQFIQIIMARANGEISVAAARKRVRQLDRRLWLELNASWTNYLVLDLLIDEFPQAKFVLTIRDCYSWLDSMFNQLLGREHSEYRTQFHRWYAESLSPGTHESGDRVLAERGLWPLDLWLRGWHLHNSRMLDLVPSDRLFVVRTQDIRQEIPRMAEFMGVPPETLDAGRSHAYKADAKFKLLSELDADYLHERVQARCGDLMKKYFPEVRGLSDIPGYRPQDLAPSANAA
jgi:hypothetical protein